MCPGCVFDSDASLVAAGGTVAAGTTSLRRLRRRLRVYVPAADTSTECLFVLAVYVALAVVTLAEHRNVVVLNWIMGPLFLFIILYVIPECVRCLARRMGPRGVGLPTSSSTTCCRRSSPVTAG